MPVDLNLLKTIMMYNPHPDRLFYTRCWGCGKRRVFGQWWEGYQSTNDPAPDEAAAIAHWGWFCAECIVIVASMVCDRLRYGRDEVRMLTLVEVLAMFDKKLLLHDAVYKMAYEKIAAYCDSINADQQHNGY